MKITAEQIYAAVPHANPDIVGAIVDGWQEHGLSDADERETAFFLGHCAVESAGFSRLEENLFYTTTARLRAVWPSRFKSDASAAEFIRNPVALANSVYGGRLGNKADDDGWNYRGSGLLQTTGKTNFATVAEVTGLPVVEHPELLRSMPTALQAAAIYWRKNGLGKLVNEPDAITSTTKRIQGGTGGLADRTIYINRFLSILAPVSFQAAAAPILKIGSTGPRVQALQVALKRLGMYAGKIDGQFGPGTFEAVREYQETRNLHPIDGVVGRVTFAALENEL